MGPDYELPEFPGQNVSAEFCFRRNLFGGFFFSADIFGRAAVGRRSDGGRTAVRRPSGRPSDRSGEFLCNLLEDAVIDSFRMPG